MVGVVGSGLELDMQIQIKTQTMSGGVSFLEMDLVAGMRRNTQWLCISTIAISFLFCAPNSRLCEGPANSLVVEDSV